MAVPTELWIASGSAPFTKWTNAAKLRRTYDADVRGYVVELPPVTAGTPKPSLSGACGAWLRALAQASIHSHTSPFACLAPSVALPHPVLVLQLCAPAGTSVSLELTCVGDKAVGQRLSLHFSPSVAVSPTQVACAAGWPSPRRSQRPR